MNVTTIDELTAQGIKRNPNMYIASGFMYCARCQKYTHHEAYSTEGKDDCYEVCQECNCYIRSFSV